MDNDKQRDNEKSKRYYDKKRDDIAIKRKEKRIGRPLTEQEKENLIKKNIPTETNNEYFDFINSQDFTSEQTKKKYLEDMKRLNKLVSSLSITNLIQTNKLIPIIKNSPYSLNTKKDMLVIVYSLYKKLGYELSSELFEEKQGYFYDLVDMIECEQLEKRNEIIPNFNEYMDKVKNYFGENSKMYLLALLYNELTIRDDFQLILTNTYPSDKTKNYLKLNPLKHTILINKFKTEKKYSPIEEILSKKLSVLITKYIQDNNLQNGDYLFDNKLLSGYILQENKKIGINGGICLFRQMKITDIYNNPTMKRYDKIKLAEIMKHSYNIQQNYIRTQLK